MPDESREEMGTTTTGVFDRLAAKDANAENDLLVHFKDRIERLTRALFHKERRLPSLHQTADVEQGAAIRLMRAIREVRPTTPAQFMSLVAECIRRELCDLARKAFGPHGDGKNIYRNRPANPDRHADLMGGWVDSDSGPATQAEWAECHEKVYDLPEPEREVFALIYYGGHTRQEVVDRLGVSPSTVQRRYHEAVKLLDEWLNGTAPS